MTYMLCASVLQQEYEQKLAELELTLVDQLQADRSEIVNRLDQQRRVRSRV